VQRNGTQPEGDDGCDSRRAKGKPSPAVWVHPTHV